MARFSRLKNEMRRDLHRRVTARIEREDFETFVADLIDPDGRSPAQIRRDDEELDR